MEISLGEYTFIELENEASLEDAKRFVSSRNLKNVFCNYGSEEAFSTSIYSITNHFKVDKSIKIRELTLENRIEFMEFINKSNKYQQFDVKDVLDEIGKASGLFMYEKEYVGSYIIKDSVIENIYSKIRLHDFLKKLVNKFEICRIKCNSNDSKLKELIEEIGFIEEKVIKVYYKL